MRWRPAPRLEYPFWRESPHVTPKRGLRKAMQLTSANGVPRAPATGSLNTPAQRLASSEQFVARNPPSATEAAINLFRARFDRVIRDDAGQRGFFLNLLL